MLSWEQGLGPGHLNAALDRAQVTLSSVNLLTTTSWSVKLPAEPTVVAEALTSPQLLIPMLAAFTRVRRNPGLTEVMAIDNTVLQQQQVRFHLNEAACNAAALFCQSANPIYESITNEATHCPPPLHHHPTFPSSTCACSLLLLHVDSPRSHMIPSPTGDGDYTYGDGNYTCTKPGATSCEHGMLTVEQCEVVATAKAMVFNRVDSWANHPQSCFCVPGDGDDGECYFNTWPSNPQSNLLCLSSLAPHRCCSHPCRHHHTRHSSSYVTPPHPLLPLI